MSAPLPHLLEPPAQRVEICSGWTRPPFAFAADPYDGQFGWAREELIDGRVELLITLDDGTCLRGAEHSWRPSRAPLAQAAIEAAIAELAA